MSVIVFLALLAAGAPTTSTTAAATRSPTAPVAPTGAVDWTGTANPVEREIAHHTYTYTHLT